MITIVVSDRVDGEDIVISTTHYSDDDPIIVRAQSWGRHCVANLTVTVLHTDE